MAGDDPDDAARTGRLSPQPQPTPAELFRVLLHDSDPGVAPLPEASTVVASTPLTPIVAPTPSALPDRLGTIRIERLLGEGGMGQVFQGHDEALGRPVVVKVLAAELRDDPAFRARFEREARAAASLDHPNVVTIHSVEELGGQLCLVMQFVDGEDLARRLKRAGPLPLADAAALVLAAARGLGAAHRKGLIHRDVKPANLIAASDGGLKVVDFGLARRAEEAGDLTRTGQVVGTLPFMAPEQVKDAPLDGRVDVYALGATLFALLTGRPPFPGPSTTGLIAQILQQAPPWVRDHRPDVPSSVGRFLVRCLAKEPSHRPSSMEAFSAELVAAVERGASRLRLVAAGAVGAAVLLAAVAIRWDRQPANGASAGAPPTPTSTAPTPPRSTDLRPPPSLTEGAHASGSPSLARGWERLEVTTTPPPRLVAAAASCAAGVLVFGGADALDGPVRGDAWLWSGQGWAARKEPGPSPRQGAAMAFDAARGVVVLFGGEGAAALDDTWEWDGEWRERVLAERPPARAFHAATYDPARRVVVVFGGAATEHAALGDTWEWDGTRWRRAADGGPPPRVDLGLAHDPAGGGVLLFGGEAEDQVTADTWRWDGKTWARLEPTSPPPARSTHAMAGDPRRREVWLFGGQDGAQVLGDTWVWDGGGWSTRALPGPPARGGHALVADPRTGLLLFGGADPATGALSDTWARR